MVSIGEGSSKDFLKPDSVLFCAYGQLVEPKMATISEYGQGGTKAPDPVCLYRVLLPFSDDRSVLSSVHGALSEVFTYPFVCPRRDSRLVAKLRSE